ncbi:MFS transporter [Marinactinospora thermotolerans]|uniref:MFS transporter n=1 Tax=Marinactinospora thermotolerans TaxID=531310 RepID=UPI003D8B2EF6
MNAPPSTPAPPSASYRSVLAVGEFRAVFAAEILAVLGQVAAQLTLSVLVYGRTGSPLLSALVFALGFLPHLFGAALFSSITDRLPARPLLAVTALVQSATLAAMAIPGLPIPILLLLLLLSGTIAPLYQGTRAAMLPDVLPGDGYPLGRSLLRMAGQTAQIAGFAFGGALLALVGPATALLIGGGALAVSALLMWTGVRHRPARGSGAGRSLTRESLAGGARVLRSPELRRLLALSCLPPALAVTPEALAVPLTDASGGGPAQAGMLLAALPVGMIVGELTAGSLLSARTRARLAVPMAFGVFATMPLFLFAPGTTATVLLLLPCGLGFAYTLGLDRLVLDATPDEARGAVLTLFSATTMVAQGLGYAAAGALAELLPSHMVVAVAGVCGIAVVALAGRRPRRAG